MLFNKAFLLGFMLSLRRFRLVWTVLAALMAFSGETCFAGQNVGQMLDGVEGKIAATAGGLAQTGALAEKQLLDALMLRVQELRIQLQDSLDKGVDTLGTAEASALDTLSRAAYQVNATLANITKVDDLAVLDINVLLARLHVSQLGTEARRITPSAQVHRESGVYTYEVTLPLFGTGRTLTDIRVNNVSYFGSKIDLPPHGFRVNVPASALEGAFDTWSLTQTKLDMDLDIPNRSWWQPWRPATRKVTISLNLGLFPKSPLRYWLAEHTTSEAVDQDPAHLKEVASETLPVPGCGNSGCYLSYNVCASTPAGSQPLGDLVSTHDSFNGWGEWLGPPRVTGNVVCMTYQQHSHNQTRLVWFSTRYRPTMSVGNTQYVALTRLGVTPVATEVPSQLKILAHPVALPASAARPAGGATPNPGYVAAPPIPTAQVAGALEYGQTYLAPYTAGAVWELVVQDFSGQTIVVTPTGGSTSQVSATKETGRLKVVTKAPY